MSETEVEGVQNDISDGMEAFWHLFMAVFIRATLNSKSRLLKPVDH